MMNNKYTRLYLLWLVTTITLWVTYAYSSISNSLNYLRNEAGDTGHIGYIITQMFWTDDKIDREYLDLPSWLVINDASTTQTWIVMLEENTWSILTTKAPTSRMLTNVWNNLNTRINSLVSTVLTTETDPIWNTQSGSYYTKTQVDSNLNSKLDSSKLWTLANWKWCRTNWTQVICDVDQVTDTKYTAWTWITLNWTQFSADLVNSTWSTLITKAPTINILTQVWNSLSSALNNKANIASPNFTWTPKAPNPTADKNDTTIATTKFVRDVVEAAGSASSQNSAQEGTWLAQMMITAGQLNTVGWNPHFCDKKVYKSAQSMLEITNVNQWRESSPWMVCENGKEVTRPTWWDVFNNSGLRFPNTNIGSNTNPLAAPIGPIDPMKEPALVLSRVTVQSKNVDITNCNTLNTQYPRYNWTTCIKYNLENVPWVTNKTANTWESNTTCKQLVKYWSWIYMNNDTFMPDNKNLSWTAYSVDLKNSNTVCRSYEYRNGVKQLHTAYHLNSKGTPPNGYWVLNTNNLQWYAPMNDKSDGNWGVIQKDYVTHENGWSWCSIANATITSNCNSPDLYYYTKTVDVACVGTLK